MRGWIMAALCTFIGVSLACQRDHQGPSGGAATVSYYKDIKPLMDSRCVGCHAEDQVAFSLSDLASVAAKRHAVVDAVAARRMPVWLAAQGHQAYVDDPTLTDEQVKLFQEWAAADFPSGEPADAPVVTGGALLTDIEPDVSLPILPKGQSYVPNQDRPDDYHCFVLDWPFAAGTTTHMVGFQAVPGNPQLAHHIVAYKIDARAVAMLRTLDDEEDGPGYQCFGGALPDRLGDPAVRARMEAKYPEAFAKDLWIDEWLGHWAPGMRGNLLPDKTGVPIHGGGVLVAQIHYFTRSAPPRTADAGTEVRLMLQDRVVRPGFVLPLTNNDWLSARDNRTLVVTPGKTLTVEHAISVAKAVQMGMVMAGISGKPRAAELYTANLHMHSFGKSAVAELQRPDRSKGASSQVATETLLEIPRWDLRWQRDYTFAAPKIIPMEDAERTKIGVRCTFENTTDDEVFGGFGSGDEMCFDFSFIALALEEEH